MKKEFNLSKKLKELVDSVYCASGVNIRKGIFRINKEFIKKLKVKMCMYGASGKEAILCRNCSEIDKLAGKELI